MFAKCRVPPRTTSSSLVAAELFAPLDQGTSLTARNEKCFCHLVCRPALVSHLHIRTSRLDTYQQMAVLGIVVMILGFNPRK